MAYADLLERDNINSQYLAVLNPRRRITGTWTLIIGTRYSISFDYGFVNRLDLDTDELDEASDATVSDGDWFYDPSAQVVYFDNGSDPNGEFITAHYELYVGTFDASFNRIPTDSTSLVVYYEPLIIKSPAILQNISDVLFGFLPTQTSNISLSSVTGFFLRHLSDSSFFDAPIKIYHYLDKLETANVKQVVSGLGGNITYNDTTIDLTVYDGYQVFNQNYRNRLGDTFFAKSDFPNIDPIFQAKPIRKVFGVVEGFIPVNISYEANEPTTSDNRQWVVSNFESGLTTRSTSADTTPSTTTRTYVTNADGFTVGDSVYNFTTGESFLITAVNKAGNHYFDHSAVTTPASTGDTLTRSFVANVKIVQDGVVYTAKYQTEYTGFGSGVTSSSGFTFKTTLEASLGMPRPLSPQDVVFCKVYGLATSATLGGSLFGSNSDTTGNRTNPIVIAYTLIKDHLGLSEDELNLPSFTSLEASITGEIGFAIPRFSTEEPYTYRKILEDIFQSELLKISLDDDNKFKIEQTAPLPGTANKDVSDDEIIANSVRFEYSYTDIISDAIVAYAGSEVNSRNEAVAELSVKTVKAVSEVAQKLHKISKQKTFQSLHMFEADAADLASRLRYALGDRRGIATFKVKNRFFNTEIDDRIDINREKVPGFEYEQGTDRSISGAVISTTKSLTDITIQVDDQKGIEDNQGDW